MNYSSVTRAKIIVWTIVMFIILAGSSVLASWDKDAVIEIEDSQTTTDSEVVTSGSTVSGEVNS
jgi:hypothetical protein